MPIPSAGDVYFGHVPEASKDKIFVILSVQDAGGDIVTCLLINSSLNATQLRNSEIQKLKMPLIRKPYLHHDSLLDCEGPILRTKRYFLHTNFKVIGRMDKADLMRAKKIIYESGNFSEYELEDMCIYPEDYV
jgi:hypothetical protein